MDLSLRKYFLRTGNKSLSKQLQLRFLKRLSRLLKDGYTLIEAFEVIKWDEQLKSTATTIIELLKGGDTIDQALEKADFTPSITSYLYFVRESGDIQLSIEKCVSMYESRMEYTKKFQETLRYPSILLVVFMVLIYFVKQSVLPSFMDLFQSNSGSSSIQISILLIDYLSIFIISLGVILTVAILVWQFCKHKVSIEKQIVVYRSIPIYRKYKKMHTSFLFATHFSSLLKTGMSIKEILNVMTHQQKLPILSYFSTLMTAELTRGVYITNLLAQLPLIDKQLSLIFQKNTDVHALEKDLTVYAALITEDLHRKIMKALTYIQPVFFLLLASFIIFIYITLMWPMFQLIKTI